MFYLFLFIYLLIYFHASSFDMSPGNWLQSVSRAVKLPTKDTANVNAIK